MVPSTPCYSAEPVQIIGPNTFQQPPQLKRQVGRQTQDIEWRTWAPTAIRPFLPADFTKIVWKNVMMFVYMHIAAVYGLYLLFVEGDVKTVLWIIFILVAGAVGITCGAHRLWTHRTYKAKLPLQIFLAFWQTVAVENSIYDWSRDHRIHHKFTDTDADPHNINRGFFFAHMGWLMTKKHKDVSLKGKAVDLSDLESDPVVKFQREYYLILVLLLGFGFPVLVPWFLWNESWVICWNACGFLRILLVLHGTWCINSVAHMFGTKPFDKNRSAVENLSMSVIAMGEGWHNYHHVFPWDYKIAEFGNVHVNFGAAFIDLMAKIGWAYDLKTVSLETVAKRATRTGDGSRKYDNILEKLYDHQHFSNSEKNIWGWDDKDMTQDEKEEHKCNVEANHRYYRLWDYKANFNITVVGFMAKICYKLMTWKDDCKRAAGTGNGSRKYDNILNIFQDHHLTTFGKYDRGRKENK